VVVEGFDKEADNFGLTRGVVNDNKVEKRLFDCFISTVDDPCMGGGYK